MSGQVVRSYRWSDKPTGVKQALFCVVLVFLVTILVLRWQGSTATSTRVRAFTQPGHSGSSEETAREMAKSGIDLSGKSFHPHGVASGGGNHDSSMKAGTRIHERPLFDGM